MKNHFHLCRFLILFFFLATNSGCQLVAGLYHVVIDPFVPPPLIPAQHDMSNQSILIWIDYTAAAQEPVTLRRFLTEELSRELLTQNAAGTIVDYGKIMQYRALHPNFAQTSIADLGKAFSVEQVVYLQIDNFSFAHNAGPGYYDPSLSGMAKIIDGPSARRVWPSQNVMTPFNAETRFYPGTGDIV